MGKMGSEAQALCPEAILRPTGLGGLRMILDPQVPQESLSPQEAMQPLPGESVPWQDHTVPLFCLMCPRDTEP